MLLTDDRGNTVDWFETYFNNTKQTNHYMHLSGGADSALTLYIMAKCLYDKKRTDETLNCIYIQNISKRYKDPGTKVPLLINYVESKFAGVKIKLWKVKAETTDKNKGPILQKNADNAGGKDSIVINSIQRGPKFIKGFRDKESLITGQMFKYRPYVNVDKRFFAYQYKKFDLMGEYYNLTVSCTSESHSIPCRKCNWCQEKYWAFGSYDGGVKPEMIHILTLKVGTKYGSEYVNNLYRSIKKNSTTPFTLYCYTEDSTGLDEDIVIVPLEDPSEFSLQWHKVKFHKINFANIPTGEKCIILDIDWIVTSDMDPILDYDLPERTFGCFERWWSNLRHLCKINGGFQMYYMGDTHRLWMTFSKNPDHWQNYYVKNGLATGPVNGEQNFIDMHVELDREWLPMMWFAKWQEDDWLKIQKNWNEDVSKDEPYYMGGDFAESIKMVHFSNADNLITEAMEKHDWIKDFWN
jgi:hypothetical protein